MGSIATLRDLTEALIESAREEGKLEKVTADMEGFFSVLSSNDHLKNILWSTTFEISERKAIAQDICRRESYDPLTANFLSLVFDLEKFKSLELSEQTFIQKLRKATGKLRAEIVTASQPAEEDLNAIKSKLTQIMGRDVEVESKVDPSIIVGIVAKVEDKVFDGSIKTQLDRMKSLLTHS